MLLKPDRVARRSSGDIMSSEHAHNHDHGDCCKHSHANNSSGSGSGFRYFVPGLVVGFILGAVVGVLVPEMRGGGPPLQPRGDSPPRQPDEDRNPQPPEIPAEGADASTDGTASQPTPDAPASSGGH